MPVLLCRGLSPALSLSSQSIKQSALKELPEGSARQHVESTAKATQPHSPHQQPGLVTEPGTGGFAPLMVRKRPMQPSSKLPALTEQQHSSDRPLAQLPNPFAAAAQAARLAFSQPSSSSRGSATPPAAGASHGHDQLQGLQGIMQHPCISPQRSNPLAQAGSPLPSECRQPSFTKQAVPGGPRTVQSGALPCCSLSPSTLLSAWTTLKAFVVTRQGFCPQVLPRTRGQTEQPPPKLMKGHLL